MGKTNNYAECTKTLNKSFVVVLKTTQLPECYQTYFKKCSNVQMFKLNFLKA
jgi:hypothetical protein